MGRKSLKAKIQTIFERNRHLKFPAERYKEGQPVVHLHRLREGSISVLGHRKLSIEDPHLLCPPVCVSSVPSPAKYPHCPEVSVEHYFQHMENRLGLRKRASKRVATAESRRQNIRVPLADDNLDKVAAKNRQAEKLTKCIAGYAGLETYIGGKARHGLQLISKAEGKAIFNAYERVDAIAGVHKHVGARPDSRLNDSSICSSLGFEDETLGCPILNWDGKGTHAIAIANANKMYKRYAYQKSVPRSSKSKQPYCSHLHA